MLFMIHYFCEPWRILSGSLITMLINVREWGGFGDFRRNGRQGRTIGLGNTGCSTGEWDACNACAYIIIFLICIDALSPFFCHVCRRAECSYDWRWSSAHRHTISTQPVSTPAGPRNFTRASRAARSLRKQGRVTLRKHPTHHRSLRQLKI